MTGEPLEDLPRAQRRESRSEYDSGALEDRKWGLEQRTPTTSPNGWQKRVTRTRSIEDESLLGSLCAWIVQYQIGLSVNLLLLLTLAHLCFARARPITRKFFTLSYYDPATGEYTRGWDDVYFVAFWVVVFTGLRAVVLDYVLKPFAAWRGIEKRKARVRFAEQAWLFLYTTVFWHLGMRIFYHSKYWLNFREMWTDFPARSMSGTFKWYYLAQYAFLLQQIVVVNIEERRKDHWQMFTHHVITCALVFTSYGAYQTRVGNVILCLMDGVDVLLALTKMLKYLGYQTACDVAFGTFIVAWFMLRHVGYLLICWSAYSMLPVETLFGCYSSVTGAKISSDGGNKILPHFLQPFRDPDGIICFNPQMQYTFLALLLALQVLTLIWFWTIIRVAYRVLSGGSADDTRIDEEDEAEHEVDPEMLPQLGANRGVSLSKPIEDEVGVEGLNLNRRTSPARQFRKSGARTSGISIPGHSDRKELLGRIGCDKPS